MDVKFSTEPPKPTWDYRFAPNEDLVVRVVDPPCAFHRWMQLALLGIRWRKLP